MSCFFPHLFDTNVVSETHCNSLQDTATHCNSLQLTAHLFDTNVASRTHCNTLQHTATHCNTLQHTAIHCNTLRISSTRMLQAKHRDAGKRILGCGKWKNHPLDAIQDTRKERLKRRLVASEDVSATRCNTLQHTATHCDTL